MSAYWEQQRERSTRADERAVEVSFCASPARLPEGPWALAAALGVPVVLGLGLYRGARRYSASFELFSERVQLPRATRGAALRELVQGYATRLEQHATLAPDNWFNFYDFWGDERPSQTP